MQLRSLRLRDFVIFTDYTIELDGKLTRLIGANKAGKTTIGVTSIWVGLFGAGENARKGCLIAQRWRLIAKGAKSADIYLEIYDEIADVTIIARRHITKDSQQITFEAPEGYPVSDEWLRGLLNAVFLDPKTFLALSPREKAVSCGIDIQPFLERIKERKEAATIIRSDMKALGPVAAAVKVKPLDISSVLAERKRRADINTEINKQRNEKASLIRDLRTMRRDIAKAKSDLIAAESAYDTISNDLGSFDIEDRENIAVVEAKLEGAAATNIKASEYKTHVNNKWKLRAFKRSLNRNKTGQESIQKEIAEYIQSVGMKFKELSVDEDGGLLFNSNPMTETYMSTSESIIAVARIHAMTNPDLKVIFVDKIESLDEAAAVKLVDTLIDMGYQVITAERKGKPGGNIVVLRGVDDKVES